MEGRPNVGAGILLVGADGLRTMIGSKNEVIWAVFVYPGSGVCDF